MWLRLGRKDKRIQVGKSYEFELLGARSSYTLTAEVTEVSASHVALVTKDGRRVKVPATAVKSATKKFSPPQQQESRTRSQGEISGQLRETLRTISSEPDLLKRTRSVSARLEVDVDSLTSRLYRQKVTAILRVARDLESILVSNGGAKAGEIRRRFASAEQEAKRIRIRQNRPGGLAGALDETLRVLVDIERLHSRAVSEARLSAPRILTQDKVNVTRGKDNEFDLPIRAALDQSSPAVHNVRLILDQFRGLKVIGSLPGISELQPGDSVTLTARMRDSRRQGSRTDVRVDAHLSFVSPSGVTAESPRQLLNISIHGKEDHQEIKNPFRAYAGGLPVVSREMFFGRKTLIDEFLRELIRPPGGMCYALYGQQRTGKSSVLEQVRSRLADRGAIVASLSMGTMDRRSLTIDFVEEVLDQFRVQIDRKLPNELSAPLLARWPNSVAIERRPLRSLQRAREAGRSVLRNAGHAATPFVVVVDEFTYLHEILRRQGVEPREHNELRDFMRQLKGLLEARLFSALLVGQDTMPRFLDSYPNEFSVMDTRRLDYLTVEETEELADLPVRTPGNTSRYSGYALSTIATYTDGHPFFTQILCDRIIETVNSRHRSNIAQSDVEEAVESLISGRGRIEQHKFDCLVSADNTHTLLSALDEEEEEDGSQLALEVLRRIAILSGSQNNPVGIDLLQLNASQARALDDLLLRGVIRETDAGVMVRVLLYAEYLRRRAS